ncbi:MAG: hypothetical protein WAW41_14455, partial [Methylobacter sp.]
MYQIKRRTTLWLASVLIIAWLGLTMCTNVPDTVVKLSNTTTKIEPAEISKTDGSEFNRVILSEKAAQRLDIQTVPVREEQVNGTPRLVIPYAAVLYGLHGETWAYTSPKSLTFVRQLITIDSIEGDKVILSNGPAPG